VTEKPFYFMVALWGERYRDRFAGFFLPSLLAPGNLPRLRADDGHRFLVATTRADWALLERLPIMAELRRYVLPVLVEIPDDHAGGYTAALHRQTRCLKQLFEAAYPDKPYGCLLLPDLIVSDGLVATLIRSATAGHQLVLLPALRQIEEDVLEELSASGLLASRDRPEEWTRPLTLAPRTLADLALRHLHPEVAVFEEGNPRQPLYPPFRFWRVPQRNGVIVRGFFGLPILMDFAAVPPHHADCLDHDDYEAVYLGRNFSAGAGLHVVEDSDECGILSLTERALDRSMPRLAGRFGSHLMPRYALLANLRQNVARYCHPQRDVVRRDLFRHSAHWHADERDDAYLREAARIDQLIDRAAGDYYDGGGRFPSRFSLDPRYLVLDLASVPQFFMRLFGFLRILAGGLTGNREEAVRLRQTLSALLARPRKFIGR
jgi:hypothetical protein